MQIRAIPSPADFPVISTPGFFTGWTLTIEISGELFSVDMSRQADKAEVISKLEQLAGKVRQS